MSDDSILGSAESTAHPPVGAPAKRKVGFAILNREEVRELARRGGAAAHRVGTAHEYSSEEARAAGRKGGMAAQAARRALRQDAARAVEDDPSRKLPA